MMRELQKEIIEALQVSPSIEPGIEVRDRVHFLKAYLKIPLCHQQKRTRRKRMLSCSFPQKSVLEKRMYHLKTLAGCIRYLSICPF